MNKHLKRAIQLGLGFGGAMAGIHYFRTGRLVSIVPALVAGAIFGAGMAWYTARHEKRLLAQGFDVGDMTPRQSRQMLLPGTRMDAFEAVQDALRSLPKLTISEASLEAGTIEAKTGFTLRSFGEKLVVKLDQVDEGVLISVSSEPRLSTTDADGGKGVENVENIVRSLATRGAIRRAA